jgi:hypothetical protein
LREKKVPVDVRRRKEKDKGTTDQRIDKKEVSTKYQELLDVMSTDIVHVTTGL